MSCKSIVKELAEITDSDLQKISDKNRPTLLYKKLDRLVQVQLSDIMTPYHNELVAEAKAKLEILEVTTLKELATLMVKQNKRMDDVTFVYYADKSNVPSPLSLALIQNETKSNLIRVVDADLAKKLDLQPGKFYCYYKPSFANYDP